MKTYNKPLISIEEIKVEDILSVSVQDSFNDWTNNGSTFEDLWNKN